MSLSAGARRRTTMSTRAYADPQPYPQSTIQRPCRGRGNRGDREPTTTMHCERAGRRGAEEKKPLLMRRQTQQREEEAAQNEPAFCTYPPGIRNKEVQPRNKRTKRGRGSSAWLGSARRAMVRDPGPSLHPFVRPTCRCCCAVLDVPWSLPSSTPSTWSTAGAAAPARCL